VKEVFLFFDNPVDNDFLTDEPGEMKPVVFTFFDNSLNSSNKTRVAINYLILNTKPLFSTSV
jgi:hypothetical protein